MSQSVSLSHSGSSIHVLLYVSFLIFCLFIYGLARIQRRKINGKFRFALKVCLCVCMSGGVIIAVDMELIARCDEDFSRGGVLGE